MAMKPVRLRSHIPALVKAGSRIETVVVLHSEIPLLWRGKSVIVPRITLRSRVG